MDVFLGCFSWMLQPRKVQPVVFYIQSGYFLIHLVYTESVCVFRWIHDDSRALCFRSSQSSKGDFPPSGLSPGKDSSLHSLWFPSRFPLPEPLLYLYLNLPWTLSLDAHGSNVVSHHYCRPSPGHRERTGGRGRRAWVGSLQATKSGRDHTKRLGQGGQVWEERHFGGHWRVFSQSLTEITVKKKNNQNNVLKTERQGASS